MVGWDIMWGHAGTGTILQGCRFRVAAFVAASLGAPQLNLDQMLVRAAAYVGDFQRQLSGIVAEERYEQTVRFPRTRKPGNPETRELRSDLLLVRPAGATEWYQFRDVYEVDGEAVRDRSERLVKLFLEPSSSVHEQISAIMTESARYNVGALFRTVNAPVVALQILEAKNQRRFKFKRSTDAAPAEMTRQSPAPPGSFKVSTEVWVVQFSETQSGTMIRTTAMKDLPARGRFWIEPASGRVLMSELVLEDRSVRGTIDVNYQSEPLVGLLVPIEMRERYDRLRDGSVIDGFATYGRFRQFQVNVSESFLLKK
jgi:hypothetical protein